MSRQDMGLRRKVPYLVHFRKNEDMIYTLFTPFEGERRRVWILHEIPLCMDKGHFARLLFAIGIMGMWTKDEQEKCRYKCRYK